MRITCPRCNACYEVPDAVMPPGGRDVQCSDCGHSWYQLIAARAGDDHSLDGDVDHTQYVPFDAHIIETPGFSESSEEPEETKRVRRLRAALDGHKSQPRLTPTLSLGAHFTEDSKDETSSVSQESGDPSPDPELSEPPKRELDPAVAEVLRAEAEFERQARLHGPAVALEMQPELGLVPPSRKSRDRNTVRDRLARLQEAERDAATTPLTGGEESFPDPVGLYQGLTTETGTAVLPATRSSPGLPIEAPTRSLTIVELEAARARRGFRWGFATSLSACVAVAGLYVWAPYLAVLLPEQSAFFEEIARTGATWHLALADRLQETFERFNAWVTGITPPSA